MKKFEPNPERRKEKIAERQNLNQRKHIRDKRFHPIDDEEDDISAFERYIKGGKKDIYDV